MLGQLRTMLNKYLSLIVYTLALTQTACSGTTFKDLLDYFGSAKDGSTTVVGEVTITETNGATAVTEGSAQVDGYSISLNEAPVADVVIAVAADSEVSVFPETLTFTADNWEEPQTVTVSAVNDSESEGNHTGTITHTVTSEDETYSSIEDFTLEVAVTDNDSPGIQVRQTGGGSEVSEAGQVDSYSMMLNTEPSDTVRVIISTDSQSSVDKSVVTFNDSNWNIPQSVTISAVDDSDVEGDHTSTISHQTVSNDDDYDDLDIADISVRVNDNDASGGGGGPAPGIAVNQSGGSTVIAEGGSGDNFTLVLNAEPDDDVMITLNYDSQISLSPTVLTFTASDWDTPQAVTVTAVDDAAAELPVMVSVVTFSVTSTDTGYNGYSLGGLNVFVNDNDSPNVLITESDSSTQVSEDSTATDSISVVLTTQPTAAVTVDLIYDTGQLTVTPSSLTFTTANWDTPRTVNVGAFDDDSAEASIHTAVILPMVSSSDTNYDGLAVLDVLASISDNDSPAVEITGSISIDEATPGSDTYTIKLSTQPLADVTINISTDGQTTADLSSVTFTTINYKDPQTVTITAVDDLIEELDTHSGAITHSATSSDSTYNGITIASITASIADDDTAGLDLTSLELTTDEGNLGNTLNVDIALTSEPTSNVIITVSSDGQTSIDTPTLTFTPANWFTPQAVTGRAVDDDIDEADPHPSMVSFSISSSDSFYNSLDTSGNTQTVNVDDDDASGVTIVESGGSTDVQEATAATPDTYTVVLTSEPTDDIDITITSQDTTDGVTVSPASLTFTSANWDTPQTVSVFAVDDANSGETPIHTADIHNVISAGSDTRYASYATLNNPIVVTPNIADNDNHGVTLSSTTVDVNETGTTQDSYTITLNTEPSADVDVTINIVDGETSLVTAATLTFTDSGGGSPWNVAQTVTVQAVAEGLWEGGAHTGSVTHSVSSADLNYDSIAVSNVTANITDAESQPVIDFSVASQSSGTETGTMTVTAEISAGDPSEANITVPYSINGSSTATGSGTDYSLSPASNIVITAGNTSEDLTITVATDTLDEDNETIIVDMGTPTSGLGVTKGTTIDQHTATITDDDAEPDVDFTSASQSSGTETGTMTITATLTAASGKTITVPFSVNGSSTAADPADYSITASPLTFNPGVTTQDITITIATDSTDEDNETVVVDIGSPTNASASGTLSHTATIDDDDAAPTVAFTSASQSGGEESGTMTITAQLSAASGKTVTVPYTVNGSSTATGGGTDYSITASPLSFTPGDTSEDITITLTSESVEEDDETVIVDIGSPTNATASGITSHTATITDDDRDGPAITSADYYDTDGNGRIDHLRVVFDEAVDDSTIDGYAGDNQVNTATTVWAIAGYTNVRLDTQDSVDGGGGEDDNTIWFVFNEISSGYDTGAKPDLTVTDASLQDLSTGNCYLNTSNANCATQTAADVITADVVEGDAAAPIMTAASGITGSATLTINFSEPVDGTSGSNCSGNVAAADFSYTDVSGADVSGISSMAGDADGCDNNQVTITLDTTLASGDVDTDTIAAVASAIFDADDNAMGTTAIDVTGAIAPKVQSVTATSATTIRITYSEAVNNAQAQTLGSYTLTEDPTETGCAGSGTDTISLTGSVTKITDAIYELTTNNDQCSTTTYRLEVTGTVTDQDDGVALTNPVFGTFLGNERLKIDSATCSDLTTILVTFNKDVKSGTGTGGAESTTRYKLTGPSSLGSISSATRGGVGNENIITLVHATDQTGGTYTVIGSNEIDSDGFDDNALGAIQNDASTEDLQENPNDRVAFVGCGTAIEGFSQGPMAQDPFGDGSDFGFLASHGGQVYIGPNQTGNTVNRFDPDGSNPLNVTFSITQDTGTGTHANSATTRDGGITVPPYVTFGFTGCTPNSADLNSGCGPDNEDGRGYFSVGTLNSTNYLFYGGTRSGAGYDYIYYSADIDSVLNFNYIDLGNITGSATQGLSSMVTNSDFLFAGMAKDNIQAACGGTGCNIPDFGKVDFDTGCTPGSDCEAESNGGARFRIDRMPYFGGDTNGVAPASENTGVNYAAIVNVDALFVFNNLIYAANGGYNQVDHNGSIIRSTIANPDVCTDIDVCPDWAEIGPRDMTEWHGSGSDRFSIQMTQVADILPQDRAFAQFAEFNGNLYVTRTTCTLTNGSLTGPQTADPGTIAGCTDGTYTLRETQLWKCDPTLHGGATTCDHTDSGNTDWSLIDGISAATDGVTNFGDTDNHSMTMAITNGSYLYIGFDNTTGVQIYRTKMGVTDPADEDDFELVSDGLTDPTNMQEIYSTISIQQGADYFIYLSAGKNSEPVAVFRQKND